MAIPRENVRLALEIKQLAKNSSPIVIGIDILRVFSDYVCSKCPLGPDDVADLKRLPTTVNNLSALAQHIVGIQSTIKDITVEEKKAGKLRTYKNLLLSVYALRIYVDTEQATVAKTVMQHAVAIAAVARDNLPGGLSVKATTLWTKTWTENPVRCYMLLTAMIRWSIARDPVAIQVFEATLDDIVRLEQQMLMLRLPIVPFSSSSSAALNPLVDPISGERRMVEGTTGSGTQPLVTPLIIPPFVPVILKEGEKTPDFEPPPSPISKKRKADEDIADEEVDYDEEEEVEGTKIISSSSSNMPPLPPPRSKGKVIKGKK